MKTTENAVGSAKPKKAVSTVKQPAKLLIRRLKDSTDLVVIDRPTSSAALLDPFSAKLIADIIRTSTKAELLRLADELEDAFDDYKLRNPE